MAKPTFCKARGPYCDDDDDDDCMRTRLARIPFTRIRKKLARRAHEPRLLSKKIVRFSCEEEKNYEMKIINKQPNQTTTTTTRPTHTTKKCSRIIMYINTSRRHTTTRQKNKNSTERKRKRKSYRSNVTLRNEH